MEDSWRFRPIQGNICPTCSTSHFPFCSQPLPFDRNGFGGTVHQRIPNDPSFHRPLYAPFSDNRMMPRPSLHYDDRVNSMAPMYGNQKDVYGKPRSWNGNLTLEFPHPPPMADSAMFNRDGFNSQFDYGSDRFGRGEFYESERIHKRIKVDEMSSGSFAKSPAPVGSDYPSIPKQISIEDERRLNLIRQHGGPTTAVQSHGSLDSSFRLGNVHGGFAEGGNQVNAYFHDGSVRPPNHKGTNNSGADHSSSFVQQQMPNNTNGFRSNVDHSLFRSNSQQLQHSDYGNNPLHPSLQSHGPSKVQTGAPNSTSQQGDLYQHPIVPHHSSYPISQASHEEYHAHDIQQLQSKDLDPFKDRQYPYVTNRQVSSGYQGQQSDLKHSFEVRPPPLPGVEQFDAPNLSKQGSYLPMSSGNGLTSARQGQIPAAQPFGVRPPLPPLPPPPFPMEPAGPPPPHMQATSSAQYPSSSFYPVPASSSVSLPLLHQSARETQSFPLKHPSPDKPKVIDASLLLRRPHRASRPDHIVIILRGLPGSGKSYLAKMLRDLEVENGGNAPRIHSMDDYFMTEVEKVEERERSKSSNSVRGKKQITKKVMEYCYEPEMEEAYRSSMLKAFKKNLEEGSFTFIIVDDRNLRVADFAQFWASAKRSGYEVYLLEATYKDPVGCAARNVHGFTSDDIKKMAELWEEAPSLYLQLDAQSLFHGDGLDDSGIQEVDMDTEDVACVEDSSGLHDGNSLKTREQQPVEDYAPHGSFKDDEERWDTEGDNSTGVKELGRSKWSQDLDEEDTERREGAKRNSNVLSGLIETYSKGDKSVHWGDQVGKTGFSIGAAKKANMLSLVIGPGAGYNLKSNPLLEENNVSRPPESSWESNKRTVFQEHLRAERESFRAVFDRRRQRIGGLEADDE